MPGDSLSDLEFVLGKCLEHLSKTSGYDSSQLKGTFMRKKNTSSGGISQWVTHCTTTLPVTSVAALLTSLVQG